MDKIQKEILDSIDIVLEEKLKKINRDYTIIAKIVSNDGGGLFTVLYNNQNFQVKTRGGLTLSPDDIVYVRVVQGNWNDKFIDCIKP